MVGGSISAMKSSLYLAEKQKGKKNKKNKQQQQQQVGR